MPGGRDSGAGRVGGGFWGFGEIPIVGRWGFERRYLTRCHRVKHEWRSTDPAAMERRSRTITTTSTPFFCLARRISFEKSGGEPGSRRERLGQLGLSALPVGATVRPSWSGKVSQLGRNRFAGGALGGAGGGRGVGQFHTSRGKRPGENREMFGLCRGVTGVRPRVSDGWGQDGGRRGPIERPSRRRGPGSERIRGNRG